MALQDWVHLVHAANPLAAVLLERPSRGEAEVGALNRCKHTKARSTATLHPLIDTGDRTSR